MKYYRTENSQYYFKTDGKTIWQWNTYFSQLGWHNPGTPYIKPWKEYIETETIEITEGEVFLALL